MEQQLKIQKLIDQMKDNVSKATGKRNDSIDYQLLTDLRKTHRELYRSIEGNRRTNQLEKDQLDKQTINSECLKYSKTQLQLQIGQFKALQTNNYNQIKKQLDLEDKNPLDHNKEILHKLEIELEVRREKKKKYEEITNEFEHLQQHYEQKKSQYFQVLPDLLKQTQSNLLPALNIFEIPHLALPSQQEFFQQLPLPLHQIYQKLQTKFIKLEIISHPIADSIYKQSQFELKVTLEQGIYDEIALNYLGVKQEQFYENIYPFSFSIRYFTTLDKIVFQVDRKNQITSEELFCGLFQGDPGEPIFVNAKSDEEININTKYMTFRWAKLLTGFELSAQEFYQQLQKRIYNIQLIKIQLQKLQKNELLTNFPGLNFEQRYQLKYFGNSQINDDIPFWYKFCLGESLIYKQNKDTTLLVEDKTLQSYIQLNYRFEGQAEHLHDCYKMVLAKDDQQIEIGIIVPLSYPQQSIRYQILSTQNINISQYEFFIICKNLGSCLIEGLQLSYQILRIIQQLSERRQNMQYFLKHQ
ncbi:unnamed protein product [Paramecium sonneborni]|uniref:Uncharacterized protein n=1 Tax=Paramecium sonneborni TaxID=65129 RepID=A0A8S1NYD0_9CILI|nr:unnamed protein product [Paramecium sonneborni]